MRTIRSLPKEKSGPIRRTAVRDERFERFLKTEIEDEISAQAGVMTRYQDYIRMYRGFPSESFSRDPVPIRNIEVTLGATATDTLFSQSWDMIWSTQPIVTVRNAAPDYEEHAIAFQELENHLAVDPFTNYVESTKNYMMDDIMLGTGIYYTTWQEDRKKTKLEETVEWGPRVYAPAPEDLVFPTTSGSDIETVRNLGFGNELTYGDLMMRGTAEGWDWEIAAPTRSVNSVKRQRMIAEHVTDSDADSTVLKYQIYELFIMFDYDEDGFDEDLYVVWDRFGARILFMAYNPFDSKPFSIARYQFQPHAFLGVGVMEMDAPYEREVSDWHNFRMANARLVGSRAWGVKIGSPMSGTKLRIIPNKPLYFNDPTDIKEFKMADIYPSALQTEQYSSQLARERVGTMTDFQAKPMPGHRTPGVTMMAMLQQINKRFTTAFEEMRAGMAHALMQCTYRMHEKYREGGETKGRIEEELTKLLGPKAEKVFEVFRKPTQELRSKVRIEMTASSQSINREADKQNALQRLQVLGGYYDKVLQLAVIVANPQTPPAIKELAVEIAKRSTTAMGQFLRAYESVRNAKSLLIDEEAWDALVQQASGQGQPGGPPNVSSQGAPGGMPSAGGNAGGQGGGSGEGAGAPGNDSMAGDGGTDGLGL